MDGTKIAILGLAGATVFAIFAFTREAKVIPPPLPGLTNVYGKVTDVITGQVVSGVRVTLDTLEEFTDSGGNYLFAEIDPGGYILTFEKEGYLTLTME